MPDQPLHEWLATLPNVSNVSPVQVKIGRTTYIGARYDYLVTAPPGSRAALEHRPPTTEPRIYVLGERPSSHRRYANIAYVIDGWDWYIAGWAPADVANSEDYGQYHPYGVWFGMHRWGTGEPIDRYEPYHRMEVEVN